MANVDTTKVLSDPFKLYRILYLMLPFLDEFLARNSKERFQDTSYKREVLEDILQSGLSDIETQSRSIISLERDNSYIQELLIALNLFKKELYDENFYPIFLTGVSPDNTKVGIPGRVGYDFAAQLNSLSTEIFKMAVKSPEAYTKIIFWPLSILDIPYIFDIDDNKLKPLLPNVFEIVNRETAKKGKKVFGSLEKSLDSRDIIKGSLGNYQFSEGLFNFKVFKNIVNQNPSIYQEKIKEFGRDKFFELSRYHIYLNKILMIEKYVKIFEILNLKDFIKNLTEDKIASGIPLYAIKGSYSRDILEKVAKRLELKLDIIGDSEEGGILKNVDGPSLEMAMRELNPSALRLLNGRILAVHSNRTGKFEKVKIEKRKTTPAKIQLGPCLNYKFFFCEEECRERENLEFCTCHMIEKFIKKDSTMKKALELLETEVKRDSYCLQPIESILIKLNNKDLEVAGSENKKFSFVKLIEYFNNPKIVPLAFDNIHYDRYDLRASEFSSDCNIERIIDKIDESKLPEELVKGVEKDVIAEKAFIGIITHVLMNQQPPQWDRFIHNEILKELGINPVRRESYCEKSVIYNHKGIIISGHPDVVVKLDGTDQVMVLDIKHKTFSSSEKEKRGYIYQTLAYSFGIQQMLNLNNQYHLLGLIERPFIKPEKDQTSLLDIEVVDTGVRKQQKISLWLLKDTDNYVKNFHKEIEQTYERQQLILKDNKTLLEERNNQGDNCYTCPAKDICFYLVKKVETTGKSLREVIPGEYPTTKQRSKLF